MGTGMFKAIAIACGLMTADPSAAWAAPVLPPSGVSTSDIVHVAKKKRKTVWHNTRRGQGQLLGRVEDIDRRGKTASSQRRGKPLGRVPSRNRTADAEAFNAFMLGMAGVALGAAGGLGGSGGCGIDVTTANPTGCGGRMGNRGGSNGLRPPYQCVVNGRTVTTNTFQAGCWMVRQNNTVIPMR